jgi:hypothetical protein
MVFAALDAFAEGRALSPAELSGTLPAHDSALARAIWHRQLESVGVRLGVNLAQFVRFTYLPTDGPLGIGVATRRELLRLFDALRSGRPVPLGMVSAMGLPHIATNHQVLAYAAEFGEERVTVGVYDPNHPRRDDVLLDVPLDVSQPVVERYGDRVKVWRGFFIEHYTPRHAASTETEES